jgi:type IV secretion system protein VirB10
MSWFDIFRRRGAQRHDAQAHRADAIDPETGEILSADNAPTDATRSSGERPAPTAQRVRGERAIPSVNRERSLQSRVRNALAGTAVVAILVGGLVWYYAGQFARHADRQTQAEKAAKDRAAGDSQVPPLGPVDPPQVQQAGVAASQATATDRWLGPPPPVAKTPATQTSGTGQPTTKSPEQLDLERRLGQPVLLRGGHAATPGAATTSPAPVGAGMTAGIGALLSAGLGGARLDSAAPDIAGGAGGLATSLRATPTPAVAAQLLPTRRLLLPKGAFIDCTLETAIDSTLEGMVTCIGATDVYGADGKVVLLDRGTKYVGERRGEVRQGQARVFVLWTEARTPNGVVVNLASPGTDSLGRAGLEGAVDTHFWDRFGAAILVSVIDGALQAVASGGTTTGGTSVVLNAQGTRDVMTDVLKGTLGVPPTIVKNQGDRIQVLVARDVDFRPVYALRLDEPGS